MLQVVLSKLENYADGAALISSACEDLGVSVIHSEIDGLAIDLIEAGTRIFFLTNDDRVGNLTRSLIKKGALVINGVFCPENDQNQSLSVALRLLEYRYRRCNQTRY